MEHYQTGGDDQEFLDKDPANDFSSGPLASTDDDEETDEDKEMEEDEADALDDDDN